uniref:T-box transcription factor Tbx6b n=1 Tax=Phallusia mammillata TaxID=59560 RepID=A0A6F9DTV8_9ASCI|nr:T-box transcription factor Tbx6b [Phallusia mammillata]
MATQTMNNFQHCTDPWFQTTSETHLAQDVDEVYRTTVQDYQVYDKKYSQVVRSPYEENVQVDLQDLEVWDKFSAAKTEMIVTKPGRRIFPGYRVKFSGLDPNAQYCVLMDVVNVDEHRYKFQNGEWIVSGRGEPKIPQKFYVHPKSPSSGGKLMKEVLSFHKVKLTNSFAHSATEKFNVHSMHRYQLRVHLIRTDDVTMIKHEPMSTFSFSQTTFFTVTAYQNHEVTKLKIANNPFARGFRCDGGKTKNTRRFCDVPEYFNCDVMQTNKRLKVAVPPNIINPVAATYTGYSNFQPHLSPQATNFPTTCITVNPTLDQYSSSHPYSASANVIHPGYLPVYNEQQLGYDVSCTSPFSNTDQYNEHTAGNNSPQFTQSSPRFTQQPEHQFSYPSPTYSQHSPQQFQPINNFEETNFVFPPQQTVNNQFSSNFDHFNPNYVDSNNISPVSTDVNFFGPSSFSSEPVSPTYETLNY